MKQITCPHCADTYPDFDVAHVCSKGPYAPRLKSKMNERIEKLKESACPKIDWAGRYHVELNNGEKEKWMNEWFEKFAELIVQQCIEICNQAILQNQDTLSKLGVDELAEKMIIHGSINQAQKLGKGIKQHFGVGE